jgi:5'-nucleotidase/UDP-sugar diphosphatase
LDGLRVGIFGLTLPIQAPDMCGDESIRFVSPAVAARKMVRILKSQKVDVIVALTHLRIEDDRELAARFPEIDVIAGGHDHEPIVESVRNTLIGKAGSNSVELGKVILREMKLPEGKAHIVKEWHTLPVGPDLTLPDPKVTAALAPYDKQVDALQEVVGRSEVALDIREETVREGESNFGNFVADLMRLEMGADIALINGGAFRGDRIIPPGPLTLYDINTVLLFDNHLCTIRITGKDLLRALENGVSFWGERSGRFPQISGMTFTFDPTRPVGQRVLTATVGNTRLQLSQTYTMATTDFLVERGSIDGYVLPKTLVQTGAEIKEVIIRRLQGEPLRSGIEGRIVNRSIVESPATIAGR